MILKASQRSGGRELARHLLNAETNEHITVHDIRGFVADNLTDALDEAYAISLGTRCKQYLFSLSLNPPEIEDVAVSAFEDAIDRIEKSLGLSARPRAVVFHEKNGRRHCHAVWSRIDDQRMTAVNMSHYKLKLRQISRELFLEHGWELPHGLCRPGHPNRCRFSLQEWQQAERLREDPKHLKSMFQNCWERSDTRETFAKALEERSYYLARGDRRGFVAVDYKGKVYSLTRWIDIGSRELKSRIGTPESLPTIEQARSFLAARVTQELNSYIAKGKAQAAEQRLPLVQELRQLVTEHKQERRIFLQKQQNRRIEEAKIRTNRLSSGMRGIWERITGKYQIIRRQNEAETKASLQRDCKELQRLVQKQLQERQEQQKVVLFYRQQYLDEAERLRREVARHISGATVPPAPVKIQKETVTEQIKAIEGRIAAMSVDIVTLQAALENNLLSDDMRARVRLLIEKTLQSLYLKQHVEIETRKKREQQAQELGQKQAELNHLIQQYAELQAKQEEEQKKITANRQFYNIIMNMGYSLNGIPPYQIKMKVPDEHRLDERAYFKKLRQQSNTELFNTVFGSPVSRPALEPDLAVLQLRESVLQVREILRRVGRQPSGDEGDDQVQYAKKVRSVYHVM